MTTTDTSHSRFAALRTVPMQAVDFGEGFWSRYRRTNRATAIQYGYAKLLDSGVLQNFEIAAGRRSGEYRNMRFADSDLYKWIEAASYVLADSNAEPAQKEDLESRLSGIFDLLEEAQRADGYLNTYYQIKAGIENRWHNLMENHELYCAGHLIQAAVAHHRTTGGDRLLKIAVRVADNICEEFGPEDSRGVPGHPEIEMALVELYRDTDQGRYLEMARQFVDRRGNAFIGGSDYYQDHAPLRKATEVAGHAVRQLYLLAGAADIYLESGEKELLDSVERLWTDMKERKMSITGGVGARHDMEAFGESYELPTDRPYNETCAQIASGMTSWRLALATAESRFVDLMEWTLYNSVLSGVSLDGRSYFYPNPLMSRGRVKRSDWFDCACCPPNVMRTLASIGGYFFTTSKSGLQVHLYDAVALDMPARGIAGASANERLSLRIETDYPWDGTVKISIADAPAEPWELSLRIPGWCARAGLVVNGEAAAPEPRPGSYVAINRRWRRGDVVSLSLELEPQLYESHPLVEPTRGCLALVRGPLVYCLEEPDQPEGAHVLDLAIDASQPLAAAPVSNELGEFVAISGTAGVQAAADWGETLYRKHAGPAAIDRRDSDRSVRFHAIPYFLWSNRGTHPMTVWMPALRDATP